MLALYKKYTVDTLLKHMQRNPQWSLKMFVHII